MALTISIREGEDFYVDDSRYVLDKIVSSTQALVRCGERVWDIMDDQAVEVEKDVMLSVGPKVLSSRMRLVISAPRNKNIARGELYRRSGPEYVPVHG